MRGVCLLDKTLDGRINMHDGSDAFRVGDLFRHDRSPVLSREGELVATNL